MHRQPFAAGGVDIGTNSLLLTVARQTSEGLQVLEERCVVTRLGEGLGQEGQLSREAMDRTLAVLEEYGAALVALGARARAAGTSALRRAGNRAEFLERAKDVLGFELEVLSGADEARLSYRGALSDLTGVDDPLVVDPGGGSTEVFHGPNLMVSLEVGAVRLTETFLHHDPPTAAELDSLADMVRSEAANLAPSAGRTVVAAGGTATTLAALDADLEVYDARQVHGRTLPLSRIRALRERLAGVSLAERERIPGLQPGRADIIVAGALLLEIVLEQLEAEAMTVTDRGLRYGLIAEILDD